jgi:subtilase family serine protease
MVAAVPATWRRAGRVEEDKMMTLTFAMKQSNMDRIYETVRHVSEPTSPHYGQYLSIDEVAELVRPTDAAVRSVVEWASDAGASSITKTRGGEFIEVELLASRAEKALGSTLTRFEHVRSGRVLERMPEYSLPESVLANVDLVLGLNDFFDTKEERKPKDSIGNAPYVSGHLYGDADEIIIQFYSFCKDGSQAAVHPCSPQVKAYTVVVTPDSEEPTSFTVLPGACRVVGNNTECKLVVTVPAYRRTGISITTTYSDNTHSDTYVLPTRHSPTRYTFPSTIFDMYGIPSNTRGTATGNSQAIVSFEAQYWSQTDLDTFMDFMGLPRTTPKIIGYNDPKVPGGECTLDVQMVAGVGRGVPITTWSFPNPGQYVLDWAIAVSNTTEAPLVTSISYGDTERGYEHKSGFGLAYIYRMNEELAKMAARGLTVIAGSGDAGWTNVGEAGNDLSQADPDCSMQRPFFPSASPFVLSLSSVFMHTSFIPACAGVPGANISDSPIMCSETGPVAVSVRNGRKWTTGGGFANMTAPRQSWQEDAVSGFLKTSATLPPSSMYNATGRAYPDIATIGDAIPIVWGGKVIPLGGTSSSGPIMAGLVALLNDVRLKAGKTSLGLLNPVFYGWEKTNPEAFIDVRYGSNYDGDIQPPGSQYPTTCEYGWDAQPGWDPTTGLGTPNWAIMADLVLQLQ